MDHWSEVARVGQAAAAGVPVSIISVVLYHAGGGVTQIYDRFSYSKDKAWSLAA